MEVPIGAFRCCVWRVFYLLTFVRVSLAFNLKAENLPEDVVVISGAPEGSFTLPLMHSQVSQGSVEVALAQIRSRERFYEPYQPQKFYNSEFDRFDRDGQQLDTNSRMYDPDFHELNSNSKYGGSKFMDPFRQSDSNAFDTNAFDTNAFDTTSNFGADIDYRSRVGTKRSFDRISRDAISHYNRRDYFNEFGDYGQTNRRSASAEAIQNKKREFRIKQLQMWRDRAAKYNHTRPREWRTGYQAFGPSLPKWLEVDGTRPHLEMLDRQDSQLWVTIPVGTPPVSMRSVWDTGSTNIWILTTKCVADVCRMHNPHRYDPEKSSTFRPVMNAWSGAVDFATGSLYGSQLSDKIWFSMKDPKMAIDNQVFNGITDMAGESFMTVFRGFEGIMGMAFPEMAVEGGSCLFRNIVEQLEHPSFGYYVSGHRGLPGYVTFGSPTGDPRLHNSDFQEFPVVSPFWWTLKLRQFRVGDEVLVQDGNLVIDTGTTFFACPSDLKDTILDTRGAHNEYLPWSFDIYCDPPHDFYKDGTITKLARKNYCSSDNTKGYVTYTWTPDEYLIEGRSQPQAMQAVDIDNRAMFWGAHSLRKFYALFHPQKATVEFATAKDWEHVDLIQMHMEAVQLGTDGGPLPQTYYDDVTSTAL